MNSVHLWTPELFAVTGGIQSYGQALLSALTRQLPSGSLRVQSKNDLPGDIDSNAPNLNVAAFGADSKSLRNARFAAGCWLSAYRERPDVVIAGHVNFAPLARLVKLSLNIPYVVLTYGIDVSQLSATRRRALHNADLILSISRHTRDYLTEHLGVDAERVQLLAPTFAPERFSIRPKPTALLARYHLHPDTPIILTVCRLAAGEQYKGYDQIIRTLPDILRSVPDARYLLVGAGADRPRIENLARDLGVNESVIFAGFVPDDQLADHYNLCNLFAMPSKAEGFGIVYLEALASGKPVLAGNRDGSRDALVDGELGILVDPDDRATIASEIVRVLCREHDHPNIFRGDFLRRRVGELFGPEVFQKTLSQRLKPFLSESIPALSQEEPNYVRHS